MPFLKSLCLPPHYYATWPARWLACRRARAEGRVPAMVVFYHRVADDAANSWTVSRDLFRRQVDWMRRHFELVSLETAQQRITAPRNERPCVSITFDDGYAVNCEYALPLLLEREIPFTYFVNTGNALSGAPFPHDVRMGHRFAPNNLPQLRELAAAGVELGGHTRWHADLGGIHDTDTLYDEVVTATRELEQAVGVGVRYFAFPFGQHANLNPLAFQIAREAGCEAVCSAYGGCNFPGDDAFHLQRISAEGPLLRLKSWLTLEPRRLRSVQRYDYRRESALNTLRHVTAGAAAP